MKIIQIAPLWSNVSPESYSDIGRQIYYLTEELIKQGHDVDLYASPDSQTSGQLQPQFLADKDLASEFHMLMVDRVFNAATADDLIHNHLGFFTAPILKYYQIPVLTSMHDPVLAEVEIWYRQHQNLSIVAESHHQKNHPFTWLNWQDVIYPGIPSTLFTLQKERGGYLAFYGNISPWSGVLTAIEVSKRTKIPLKIASADPAQFDSLYFNEIRPLFKGGVEFVGQLNSQADKQDFLGNALALLMPIIWNEPFHLGMVEALACGTPIIVGNGGVAGEIIEDGKNGYIVSDGLDQMVSCVHHIDSLERDYCRHSFEQQFTIAQTTQKYLNLYQIEMETTHAKAKSN